jgi:hypothetical protein
MKSRESRVERPESRVKSRESKIKTQESRLIVDPKPSTPDSRLTTHDSRLPTRPAHICAQLLHALEVSDGRRRRRKRNTTPDSIGMSIKRELLEGAVRDDPDPADFEGWLLQRCLSSPAGSGSVRAMALELLAEWRLTETSETFRRWLEQGAPSDDGR